MGGYQFRRAVKVDLKQEGIMDLFCISDGKKCEDICKHAPPSNKWPCVDCDMRCHDRAETKDAKE